METDLTDFNALFKILEKDEPGHASGMYIYTTGTLLNACTYYYVHVHVYTVYISIRVMFSSSISFFVIALVHSHQSMSFDQATTQRMSHPDSAQSDNVMFGVPITQGLKSASLEFLPTIETTHESKVATSNGAAQGHFNDLGMLNLEHSLLGSSPHLQSYFPDSHSMQNQYDYYPGNGPVDDIGFKPSTNGLNDLNSSLDSQNQLEQFGMLNGGGLFGTSDTFLDMNLTS